MKVEIPDTDPRTVEFSNAVVENLPDAYWIRVQANHIHVIYASLDTPELVEQFKADLDEAVKLLVPTDPADTPDNLVKFPG